MNLDITNVLGAASFSELYNGIGFKLAYNFPLLTSIYLTAQGTNSVWTTASWLVTAALYPLNTLKVRSQLMDTDFSALRKAAPSFGANTYRGVVPYLLLNAVFGWTLRPLYSASRLE